jgi:hypothetical protein
MRPLGALPVSGQRSPILVKCDGGDALQASTAVPFDEMVKGNPREPPLSCHADGSDRQPRRCRMIAGIGMIDGELSQHF